MRPAEFDIQKIIDDLVGTTGTIDSALDERYLGMDWNDLTSQDHDAIDSQIFECAECGWWCEVGEAHENPSPGDNDICDDCHQEDEEE